jgi:hypothetical protein
MMVQSSLFPESRQERIDRIDRQIRELLTGVHSGPLGVSLSEDEKAVLGCLRFHRGLDSALGLSEISQRTGIGARGVKGAVRNLRMSFSVPIASSKSSTLGGYYLIVTDDDLKVWLSDVFDQMRAEAAVVRSVAGPARTLELLGQLHLKAQEESETPNVQS